MGRHQFIPLIGLLIVSIIGVDSHVWLPKLQIDIPWVQQGSAKYSAKQQVNNPQQTGGVEIVKGSIDQLDQISPLWICTNQKTGDQMIFGTEIGNGNSANNNGFSQQQNSRLSTAGNWNGQPQQVPQYNSQHRVPQYNNNPQQQVPQYNNPQYQDTQYNNHQQIPHQQVPQYNPQQQTPHQQVPQYNPQQQAPHQQVPQYNPQQQAPQQQVPQYNPQGQQSQQQVPQYNPQGQQSQQQVPQYNPQGQQSQQQVPQYNPHHQESLQQAPQYNSEHQVPHQQVPQYNSQQQMAQNNLSHQQLPLNNPSQHLNNGFQTTPVSFVLPDKDQAHQQSSTTKTMIQNTSNNKFDNFDWTSYVTIKPMTTSKPVPERIEYDGQGIIEARSKQKDSQLSQF